MKYVPVRVIVSRIQPDSKAKPTCMRAYKMWQYTIRQSLNIQQQQQPIYLHIGTRLTYSQM